MSDIRLPIPPDDDYQRRLNRDLTYALRDFNTRIDLLAAGSIAGRKNTATSIPTTGTYQRGDMVWNSTPSEVLNGTSDYCILGWICVTAGPAGTFAFEEVRTLTGS